ncbi:hypothetical protein Tco_0878151 [Tanacetum coccineum]|uniref:Uncharacterized protein n=1 Tax=Tanacetum coccineum TaxID=301880 RepID=A0ABQ5BX77_9ASTR
MQSLVSHAKPQSVAQQPQLNHEVSLTYDLYFRLSITGSPIIIVSSLISGCGEVILNLLGGGSMASGIGGYDGTGGSGGSDSDLHLLQDGDGKGDGEDRFDDSDGDLYFLRGSAAISSVIAASMSGGRVNGRRTIFLSIHIRRIP